MACEVKIALGERSYPIWIGEGVRTRLPEVLSDRRGVVISDEHVEAAQGEALRGILGENWPWIVLPAGEATKSASRWADVLERLASSRLDRRSVVVAFGGGVVGDLAGFAAASYMRGIPVVQVPTSLLAMVDSSVGGKTGINLAAGKNLAGAFHQPMAVVADTAALKTLPPREYAAGLAEVVKYGAALDAGFFEWLEASAGAVLAQDPSVLERLVARCCELKADVVAEDEREAGRRAVLNFGHTMGHAIELLTGYSDVRHGEGVALGMAYALVLSSVRHGFPEPDVRRVLELLKKFGLPVAPSPDWTWESLRSAMGADKKSAGGQVRFVLSGQLGRSDLPEAVPEAELRTAWERWCGHVIGE